MLVTVFEIKEAFDEIFEFRDSLEIHESAKREKYLGKICASIKHILGRVAGRLALANAVVRRALLRVARRLEDVGAAHRRVLGRVANHRRRVRGERRAGQRRRVGRVAVRVELMVLRVEEVRVELVLFDETAVRARGHALSRDSVKLR
jgi:hypothetical protein